MIFIFAERKGFEPSIRFWRIHAFQACAFDHSATSLYLNLYSALINKKKCVFKNFKTTKISCKILVLSHLVILAKF